MTETDLMENAVVQDTEQEPFQKEMEEVPEDLMDSTESIPEIETYDMSTPEPETCLEEDQANVEEPANPEAVFIEVAENIGEAASEEGVPGDGNFIPFEETGPSGDEASAAVEESAPVEEILIFDEQDPVETQEQMEGVESAQEVQPSQETENPLTEQTEESESSVGETEAPATTDIPSEEKTNADQQSKQELETEEKNTKTEEKSASEEVLKPLDTTIYTDNVDLPAGNETLMEGFIAENLYGDLIPDGMGPGLAKKNMGGALKGNDARVYKALKKLITEVANGERSSTEFQIAGNTITGKKNISTSSYNGNGLDVDMKAVAGALIADCPYEQYWMMGGAYYYGYDGSGTSSGDAVDVTGVKLKVGFVVASSYAPNGVSSGYKVDGSKAKTVKKAVATAKSIVSKAAGLEDIEKLRYYGNRICSLTDYNYNALGSNPSKNNNPWELVWVFDGDSKTTVVCEGYSKSFQYLCDLTSFDRDIACYCLEGPFENLSYGGGGAHMWNAVTMDNGANYLIDVTHSDNGNSMADWVFLLKADSGDPTKGYYFTRTDGAKVFYGYDEQSYERSTEAARTITIKKVYLESPLLKKASNVTSGIKVTWQKVEGAEKYRVMRKTGNGSWKKLKDTTATSFTDKTAAVGVKYTYTVKAIKGSTTSGYDKSGKGAVHLYKAPEMLAAENVSGGIKVTWIKGKDAAKYQVFRKGPKDTAWKKVKTTKSTSYTDKNVVAGSRYTYTVRSLNSKGTVISARDTGGVSAICGKGKTLDTPVLTGVSNLSTGVQIKWNKVQDAAKYRILRKTGNGSWKKLADTTSVKFTDKTAKSGTKYSYTVRCVSSDGKKTTSAYNKTGKKITYYSMPELTSVSNVTGGVQLQWSMVTGAVNYRIMRKTDNGDWKTLATTAETVFTDETAIRNTTYSYTVRCVRADGKKAVSAYDKTGRTITSSKGRLLAAPVLSGIENTGSGVKVSWQAVAEAAKYRVMRKTGSGSWEKLSETTALTYTDQTVNSGTTYCYTVCCVTADGKKTTGNYDSEGLTVFYVMPPVISGFSGSAGNVTVSWKAVNGAAKYRVYYKSPGSENWTAVGDTTATSFTHAGGLNGYYYTVQCLDSSGSACSGYDGNGKQFTGGPYATITKITQYKDGLTYNGTEYKKAIFVDFVASEQIDFGCIQAVVEFKNGDVWQEFIPNQSSRGLGDGVVGTFVAEMIDYMTGESLSGVYRVTINLVENGTVFSSSSMTINW